MKRALVLITLFASLASAQISGTGNMSRSDSTKKPGYVTRTMLEKDSTYRAAQELLRLLVADTGGVKVVSRANLKDSTAAVVARIITWVTGQGYATGAGSAGGWSLGASKFYNTTAGQKGYYRKNPGDTSSTAANMNFAGSAAFDSIFSNQHRQIVIGDTVAFLFPTYYGGVRIPTINNVMDSLTKHSLLTPSGTTKNLAYFSSDTSLAKGPIVRSGVGDSMMVQSDSASKPGYATRTMLENDTTYRAAQSLLRKLGSDSTATSGYTTRATLRDTAAAIRAAFPSTASFVSKSDSTTKPGYATRTMLENDTTYRAAQSLLRKLGSDSTATSGYTTRATLRDTAAAIRAAFPSTASFVSKSDSTTKPGYVTRTMLENDTNYVANVLSLLRKANISVPVDSSMITTSDTLIVVLPGYAITVDSIGVYQRSGGTPSVVYKVLYATNARGAWTAVITSPSTITTAATEVWQSTINNATLPANGLLAICYPTVTTKPANAAIIIAGHR